MGAETPSAASAAARAAASCSAGSRSGPSSRRASNEACRARWISVPRSRASADSARSSARRTCRTRRANAAKAQPTARSMWVTAIGLSGCAPPIAALELRGERGIAVDEDAARVEVDRRARIEEEVRAGALDPDPLREVRRRPPAAREGDELRVARAEGAASGATREAGSVRWRAPAAAAATKSRCGSFGSLSSTPRVKQRATRRAQASAQPSSAR